MLKNTQPCSVFVYRSADRLDVCRSTNERSYQPQPLLSGPFLSEHTMSQYLILLKVLVIFDFGFCLLHVIVTCSSLPMFCSTTQAVTQVGSEYKNDHDVYLTGCS